MAQFFSAGEVAKAAIEIERRGQEFYLRVADKAAKPETRDFFRFFAGEEAKHRKLFEDLATRLGPVELPAWSTSGEYAEYLTALLDSHALFSGDYAEKLMSEAKDESVAVRMAMSFEKDTILFFNEMRELVPDAEKGFVQRCIDEERSHLRQLSVRLNRG